MSCSVSAVVPVAANFIVGFDLFVGNSGILQRLRVRKAARPGADN